VNATVLSVVFAASQNVAEHVGFAVIGLTMLVGAVRVVSTKNVVHAALWLVVVLAGAAAQYLLLGAEFVAVTQVLVYVGAVMVLFLFGTMLTRSQIGREGGIDYKNKLSALLVALVMAGTLGYVLVKSFGLEQFKDFDPTTTTQIADTIFGTYAIPFWGLSILLTAAAVGAIVLARRD
jgi:NADH-quinone oxidoreductase subunit J